MSRSLQLSPAERAAWHAAWRDYAAINRRRLSTLYRTFDFASMPHDSAILDVGAGAGEFLTLLREAGFERVQGIEPEPALAARAPSGLVACRGVAELSSADGPFEVVTLFGVLHHLRDFDEMREAVARIRAVLGARGRLYSAEPWAHLLRTLVTRVFLETPLGMLHPRLRLERRIWRVEKPRFENWLRLESDFVSHVAGPGGFRIELDRRDLHTRYLIYVKT